MQVSSTKSQKEKMQRFLGNKLSIFLLLFCFVLNGCGEQVPEKGSENYKKAVSGFYTGLAAVEVGDFERAKRVLVEATETAPGEAGNWNNLAVLGLRLKDYDIAKSAIDSASKLKSENNTINYNRAILEVKNPGDSDLKEVLANAVKQVPDEPRLRYLLALEEEKSGNNEAALKLFEALDTKKSPNLAAKLEVLRLKAVTSSNTYSESLKDLENRSTKWPEEAQTQFKKLSESDQKSASREVLFLKNVLLRTDEMRNALDEIKPSDTEIGDLVREPLELATPDFEPAPADTGISFKEEQVGAKSASARTASLDTKNTLLIFSGNGKEIYHGEDTIPAALMDPRQIAFFDYNFDFRTDFAIAGESGFRLYQLNDNGTFVEKTQETGIELKGSFNGVWPLDYDNEGDLDLVLAPVGKAPFILQNNGDGKFERKEIFPEIEEIVDFEYADFNSDGASDAIFLQKDGKLSYYKNLRGGEFEFETESQRDGVDAIRVGGFSGQLLNVYLENGSIAFDTSFAGTKIAAFDTGFENCESKCRIFIADIDNNAANDIIVSNDQESRIFLGEGANKFSAAGKEIKFAVQDVADFNNDGKLDLLGVTAGGEVVKAINQSKKNYNYQKHSNESCGNNR